MKHMSCEIQSKCFRKIPRKSRCLISSHLFSGSLCQVCSPKASPLSDARCLGVEERKAAAASLQGLRPSDLEAVMGSGSDLEEPGMTYLSVPIYEERFRTPESSNSQFWLAFFVVGFVPLIFFLDFGRVPRVLVSLFRPPCFEPYLALWKSWAWEHHLRGCWDGVG